jgi:hypothetical protein
MVSAEYATTLILGIIQIIIAVFALWQNYILRPHKYGALPFTWRLHRVTEEEAYITRTQTLRFQ